MFPFKNAAGDPVLGQEHLDAIQQLTDIIGNHPNAYRALAHSYGAPDEKDHEAQVGQAMYLLHHHNDFEQRFEKEVANIKGFDIGKIFDAIKKAFKIVGEIFKPIVDAIKKAVAKHKAAKAAAAAKSSAPPPQVQGKRTAFYVVIGLTVVIVGTICLILFLDE